MKILREFSGKSEATTKTFTIWQKSVVVAKVSGFKFDDLAVAAIPAVAAASVAYPAAMPIRTGRFHT